MTVNPVNCVRPPLRYPVTDTRLVGVEPTSIAGVLLTCRPLSGRFHSSRTPTFSQGTEAALLLGRPGRGKQRGEKDGTELTGLRGLEGEESASAVGLINIV